MKPYKKHKLSIPIYLIWVIWITPCTAQLDATFGTGGKVIIPIGNAQNYISGMVINNGKIILTGYYDNSGSTDFAAVQLNNDGSKDITYGTNGLVSVNIEPFLNVANAVALQSDNKVVITGYSYNGTTYVFSCVRIDNNGVLDNSFNIDGKDSVAFGSSSIDQSYSIKEIDTDKLLILGTTSSDGINNNFALAKLKNDGSYDSTFNSNGKFTYSIDVVDQGKCLGIQSDGKIIIGGYCSTGFVTIRVNTNGTIDNTFGNNGQKIITIGTQDEAHSMVIQADDKIVLAGRSGSAIAVVRLNADGSTDLTFGTNGVAKITQGTTSIGYSVALDQNNKIVVAGYTYNDTISDVFVVRFNTNGSEEIRSIISVGIGNSVGKSVLIDANNKIVIGCSAIATATNANFAVIRLDNMFVTGVIASTDITTNLSLFPNPATQNITINSPYHIEQIKVIDVIGNEVMNISSSGNMQVDVSTLPKGLYNFVITTDRGVGSKKVSVQ